MSVIINDFDVVVERPEAPASAPGEASEEAPAPEASNALSPMDIARILDFQARRQARLRAH